MWGPIKSGLTRAHRARRFGIAKSKKKRREQEAMLTDPANPDQPTDQPTDPGAIWLIHRSPIQLGRVGCKRARYMEYHSGPTGYGIRRKAESLPLVTGSAVHELMAKLILLPSVDESRRIITAAA